MLLSRRFLLAAPLALSVTPALAADKVSVGVLRFVSSGALFLGLERGYFSAEGLEVDLKFFEAAQPIAVAIASGDVQFGLTAITGGTLNLAGKGGVRIIASQGSERKGIVGNVLVVSNEAHAKGLTSFEKVDGATVAITQVGSSFHYQFGQIATAKGFDLARITMRPLQSLPNMAAAVKTGQVDAAILPPHVAGPMAERGEIKIIGPLSDIGDYAYGALFTSPKMLETQRDLARRFVRAYRKGLADYNDALMRVKDGKRVVDDTALKAAAQIGKYVYPSDSPADAARKVAEAAVFCDPTGKVDAANIATQVAWYQSQKLVEAGVDPKAVVDTTIAE